VSLTERFAEWAIDLAERRRVPNPLIRFGMRRVISRRLATEQKTDRGEFWAAARQGPIAVVPDLANRQHYEVPAAFFELVLGPRLKYSACTWPTGVDDLAAAEEAMLALTAERAGIGDGDSILDLGCGWGSFSLWAAERFPNSEVVGVSNSAPQRRSIEARASRAGLHNVTIVTSDINDFDPGRRFDRVVSVEMMEHVRNHPELFRRLRSWTEDDGTVLVHVFAHRDRAYPYETGGPADWMADTFFSGGVMPSADLIPSAAEMWFEHESTWWMNGRDYERTLEAWLNRMDQQPDAIRAALEPTYGPDTELWIQRWRMFFMACSELFGYRRGSEWGVVHHRLRPR
jgi:cyclopropane-fatty-acyl-phospholipid synthase